MRSAILQDRPGRVDHEVGDRDLLGERLLGADAGHRVLARRVVARANALDLNRLGARDHHERSEHVGHAVLDEQRGFVAAEGFSCVVEFARALGRAAARSGDG